MQNPVPRRHTDPDQPADPPSPRVLLVDDEEDFRTWFSELMRRLGFEVESAADGEAALVLLRSTPFDLLIADYQMPRMDGFELIRTIRADPRLANQYAVMLTARDDVDSKVQALTIGYDDFLAKGCTEVEVVAKVVAARRVVDRQRTLATAAREWQTLATRDDLTGVATRRLLFHEAEFYLHEGREIGIAIIDLDDFKPINDTYGHLTGDRILRDLGSIFRARTRSQDMIARYGGDEFLLLVVDLPIDDLGGAAARLIREIETMRWKSIDLTFGVTATSGLAHSSLIPEPTLEHLLDAADRDLYAKKWLKKNPGERPELYEYPGRSTGGDIVTIPRMPILQIKDVPKE